MTESDALVPVWLTALAFVSLGVAMACAMVIAVDVLRRPQPMRIMNVVWPVTALFGGVLWLWLYRRFGRASGGSSHDEPHRERPKWVPVAIGTSHCGAGCTLGDIISETAVAAFPVLATILGWQSLYNQRMFAAWVWDLVVAFVLGIVFQYLAIAPMRRQSRLRSLLDALKADSASILAWQAGMYGAMALIQFVVLQPWLGGTVSPAAPVFWFSMQLAMLVGFASSYPVNALLIRRGVKEAM